MIVNLQHDRESILLLVKIMREEGWQPSFRWKVKRRIGLTSGSYDLFHNLHLTYLQRCARHCDWLVVGVDSDDHVKRTKGPHRPIIPEHQRVALVDALKCVNETFVMGSIADFELAAQLFQPDYIFKNDKFRPQDVIGKEYCKEVITIPDVFQADSTSGIIEEIIRARSDPIGWGPQPTVPSHITPAPAGETLSASRASELPQTVARLDATTQSSRSACP